MPRSDGVELCRRLKDDAATAGIPVVILSAALPPHPAERQWDEFLRKPTPMGRLMNVMADERDSCATGGKGQTRRVRRAEGETGCRRRFRARSDSLFSRTLHLTGAHHRGLAPQVKGTLRLNHDAGGNLLVGVFC